MHVRLHYQRIVPLWFHSPLVNYLTDVLHGFVIYLFTWIYNKFSKEDVYIVCVFLRITWFIRNKKVFQNDDMNHTKIATSFIKSHHKKEAYATKVFCVRRIEISRYISWEPPDKGCIEVNFDANVTTSFDRGLGVVLRYKDGTMIDAGVRRVEAYWDGNICKETDIAFASNWL